MGRQKIKLQNLLQRKLNVIKYSERCEYSFKKLVPKVVHFWVTFRRKELMLNTNRFGFIAFLLRPAILMKQVYMAKDFHRQDHPQNPRYRRHSVYF
jgi:hypothetical protein